MATLIFRSIINWFMDKLKKVVVYLFGIAGKYIGIVLSIEE